MALIIKEKGREGGNTVTRQSKNRSQKDIKSSYLQADINIIKYSIEAEL
jgi:hypothetical protein